MKGDVLITGATGLIGGEIAVRLMKEGRRVWCIVRARSFADAAMRLERRFVMSGTHCDWTKVIAVPGDVTQENLGIDDQTSNHLRKHCTEFIHCAADTSFAKTNRCADINIAGTRNVVKFCASLEPQVRLFHMSSAAVCTAPVASVIHEDAPFAGFANDYVRSKRQCERIVRQSCSDAVILRPSIVLSHGVSSPEFARSILWVFPVMRELGIVPLTGDEWIDAVSVGFVAEAVVKLIRKESSDRVYHLSAGHERSVTLQQLFRAFSQAGHDYNSVEFQPRVDWASFGCDNPHQMRLKKLLNHYLPFLRAGVAYDGDRLKHALKPEVSLCPRAVNYCAQLLESFTERAALEGAFEP